MEQVLTVNRLTMDFGGLRALCTVDLRVGQGEIVALIGPNGAGKTTFFNCVTGIYAPSEGDILISPPGGKTRRVNGIRINKGTELGMARTFQNIRLFPNMTVLENVMIGRHCRAKAGVLGALLRNQRTRREEEEIVEQSYEILVKFGLDGQVDDLAKNLPYGAQRRLEIARAMATEPFLLLLDEPAAGMNPRETDELEELILRIRSEEKISILMIEHDMRIVMSISNRIFVLDHGEKIAEGTAAEIWENPVVIKAYLERMSVTMLELIDVETFYGNIKALKGISLSVSEGEIITLIGANGAGKSTTLMSICGIVPPRGGEILFRGKPIQQKEPHDIVALGISQVPEGRRIFPLLTVTENLAMGAFLRTDVGEIAKDRERIFSLFPILKERRHQPGGTLSGGEQQMLAISRALMARPSLLLLDEPSLGLAPLISQLIFRIIRQVSEESGTTILLVEQNANMALKVAHRGYVMENGRITLEGRGQDLLRNEEVKRAYLGL